MTNESEQGEGLGKEGRRASGTTKAARSGTETGHDQGSWRRQRQSRPGPVKGDRRELILHPAAHPRGPRLRLGGAHLPAGFTDTFTSRYIDTGELRQHAVIGGEGPPLLLVHGWPENWYAWRLLMPALARDFEVIAVDQRGIGLTDKPRDGYDTGTLAGDLVALMDALGHERFAVVGHDTGYIIGYALAADHPDRVSRVALAEVPGPPGVGESPPLFVPEPLNNRLWHIPFNRVNDELTEQLVRGCEDIFFGYEFAIQGGGKTLPDYALKYYFRLFSDPDVLAWQLRVLPRVGHHPRTERKARDPAACDARPGDQRSGKLGSSRREPRHGRRADRRHPRRRPLGRRAGSRRDAGSGERVPGSLPRGEGRDVGKGNTGAVIDPTWAMKPMPNQVELGGSDDRSGRRHGERGPALSR